MTTEINNMTAETNNTTTEDSNMTGEYGTDMVKIAEKLLNKPEQLEERCRKQLKDLDGPQRWEFCKEAVKLTLRQSEITAYSASVLKSIIHGWTDDEYREMGVVRAASESDLFLSSHLIPLADLHEKTERRKTFSRERIEDAWGWDWEEEMGRLLPKWPAETFLRELAVFAEQTPWEEAEPFLTSQVQARLERPRSRKHCWLTSRDLVREDKGENPTWKRRRKGKRIQSVEDEADEQGPSTPDIPPPPSVSTSQTRETASSEAGPFSGAMTNPPSQPSQIVPPMPTSQAVILSKKAEQSRKRKRGGTERQLVIEIPVVNLDVESRIDLVKLEAVRDEDTERLDHIEAVEKALTELLKNKDGSKAGTAELTERLEIIHQIVMARLKEKEG